MATALWEWGVGLAIPVALLIWALVMYHKLSVEMAYRRGWLEGLDAYKKADEKLMQWESQRKI